VWEQSKIEHANVGLGEAGIVKVTGKIKSKGNEGMFIGYAKNSTADTFRMYIQESNTIHETRDVQWGKGCILDLKREIQCMQ
jgi:hypothetical protein